MFMFNMCLCVLDLSFEFVSMFEFVSESRVSQPYLGEYKDDIHTPEMGTWESSGTPETLEFDCRGQNTSHLVFFISLKSY
jgi:hypothetical protein